MYLSNRRRTFYRMEKFRQQFGMQAIEKGVLKPTAAVVLGVGGNTNVRAMFKKSKPCNEDELLISKNKKKALLKKPLQQKKAVRMGQPLAY